MIKINTKIKYFVYVFFMLLGCQNPTSTITSNYFKGFDIFLLKGLTPTSDTLNKPYIKFERDRQYQFDVFFYRGDDMGEKYVFFRYSPTKPISEIEELIRRDSATYVSAYVLEKDSIFVAQEHSRYRSYQQLYHKDYLNISKKELLKFVYMADFEAQAFELLELMVRTPTECTVYSRFPREQKFFPDYKNKDKIIPFALFKEKRLYSYQNDTLQVVYEHYTKNELWKKSTSVFVKPQTGTWFLQWAGVPDTVLAVKVR